MKTLPYETATAGDRALAECQRVLEGFGCQNFGTMIDQERQIIIVAFKWRDRQVSMEASWKGYAAVWQKKHPWNWQKRGSKADWDRRALEQGRISVCSVLRDWVKAQTVAIECGVLSFEAVFMPHMLLNDGRRVLDAAQAARLLPALGQDDADREASHDCQSQSVRNVRKRPKRAFSVGCPVSEMSEGSIRPRTFGRTPGQVEQGDDDNE